MRRRTWVWISGTLFFVLLLAGIAVATWLNPPKRFELPRVAIEAELATDGSMRVVEHLTYDFTGSFTYGTRPIPGGTYQIEDVVVTEHGRPLRTIGAPYNLQWFFAAEDEERTFDIAYTVRGAAAAGADVVELYWKWIGDDHPDIGRVTVALRVPPGPGRIRAWGHGPLNGVARVADPTVHWDTRDLPINIFLEGRVAAPKLRFPALAPLATAARLPTILTEERAWAAAANAARRDATADANRERDARDALQWAAPLVALLGALGFLLVWRRWGREPPRPDDIGQYFRELPDDPPAVVDALMHWGHIRPNAFGATVLDLAQRGYLTINQTTIDRGILPDRTEYEFTLAEHARGVGDDGIVAGSRNPAASGDEDDEVENDEIDDGEDAPAPPEGTLRGFERATLDQLFATGPTVTQTELIKRSKKEQSESSARWSKFQTSVTRSLRARGYLRARRGLPGFLNITIAVLVAAVAVGALILHAWVGGAIALAWAAVQLSLTPLLRQRTPKGSRRYHEWVGVRNYLRDFSQLAEAPAGHLVLWERYLVYAVALGVSDQLARGLAARIPAEETAYFATWYVGADHSPAYGSIGHFSSGFADDAVGSFTPPSSGDGGGGGFSGGGGGGGGGGGIGAG